MANLAGLGRRHVPDERDRKFMMIPLASEAAKVTRKLWHAPPTVLDQLDTPMCVGFSGAHWLGAGPIMNTGFEGPELYTLAQKNDEFEGEDYEGSTVRGLFKGLKALGLVSEYRWAWTATPVINHLLTKGPVVIGIDWHWDMFMPDRHGFIDVTGESVGGHAVLLIGADRDRAAVRMLNSWGRGWGDRGRAWLSFTHLDRLIRDNGEAAVGIEARAK